MHCMKLSSGKVIGWKLFMSKRNTGQIIEIRKYRVKCLYKNAYTAKSEYWNFSKYWNWILSFSDDQYWEFLGLLTLIRLMDMMKYQSECWNYGTNLSNCIDTRTFPDTWKKSNIVSVHKKGDKQILGKIFEINFFNSIFEYLEEIN